jgi:hypothetical protein
MNTSQFKMALNHIDNQELARLERLWRAQAASGHAEACSIAHSFAAEQRRRSDQGFSVLANAGIERKSQQGRTWVSAMFEK